MQTRPVDRFISSGAKNSWNNSFRTSGSSRFRVKHAESVNAPPKPTTSWYCSFGLTVIDAFAVAAFDHLSGFCFSYFLVALVVQTETAPAGESATSAFSASGTAATTAPAAEI